MKPDNLPFPPIQLETDAEGQIVLNPMSGWETRSIAGQSLLLALQYASSGEALNTRQLSQLQLILTPPQLQTRVEGLQNAAKLLMADFDVNEGPVQ